MEKKKAKNIWFNVNGNVVGYSCTGIEFDKTFVYATMCNDVDCKYNLLCDGVTFNESSNGKEITVGFLLKDLNSIAF